MKPETIMHNRTNPFRITILIFLLYLYPNTDIMAQEFFLFTGTYTNSSSKGIYVLSFNANTGKIGPVEHTIMAENPSFLALSPDERYLYAVNENGGEKPGEVSAFRFDKNEGSLSFLNKQPSSGDHPCYISVDGSGKWVIAGNYSGGNFSVIPVNEDGSLSASVQTIQHSGKGTHRQRQEKAHVHAVRFSNDHRFLLVPDLGIDKVLIYPFNASALKPVDEERVQVIKVEDGNGPRHIVQHPDLPYLYLMEELSGTVSAFRFSNGKPEFLQRIKSHPDSFNGQTGSADIHISPDGNFLYASNRGDANHIAMYTINKQNGKLESIGYQNSGGKTPRNFVIDPTGNYVLVANQDSDNIVVFKLNKLSGLLNPTGESFTIPKPVCLIFGKK